MFPPKLIAIANGDKPLERATQAVRRSFLRYLNRRSNSLAPVDSLSAFGITTRFGLLYYKKVHYLSYIKVCWWTPKPVVPPKLIAVASGDKPLERATQAVRRSFLRYLNRRSNSLAPVDSLSAFGITTRFGLLYY